MLCGLHPLLPSTLALFPLHSPCLCMGLMEATVDHSSDASWIASAKSTCQSYVNKWDAAIWGQKIAIAIVSEPPH